MWHSDIRSDDSPLEADLTFTCKLKTDIPFVGRQAVEEYKASGIQKRLVCFTLDHRGPVNKDFILSGSYQIDRMGQLLDATVHMKSPFDPKNRRLMGFYDE
ncbi:SARDH [Bugula neritina]|uniref:SARDH n=1 Tax=Bugula neritina TaxID=10212 RepID=A0A7J7KM68_BUGNE|nr:SARDH [Bugula neritina]